MSPYKVTVVFDVRSSLEARSDNARLFTCNYVRVNEHDMLILKTMDGKKYTIRNWVSFIVEE